MPLPLSIGTGRILIRNPPVRAGKVLENFSPPICRPKFGISSKPTHRCYSTSNFLYTKMASVMALGAGAAVAAFLVRSTHQTSNNPSR